MQKLSCLCAALLLACPAADLHAQRRGNASGGAGHANSRAGGGRGSYHGGNSYRGGSRGYYGGGAYYREGYGTPYYYGSRGYDTVPYYGGYGYPAPAYDVAPACAPWHYDCAGWWHGRWWPAGWYRYCDGCNYLRGYGPCYGWPCPEAYYGR